MSRALIAVSIAIACALVLVGCSTQTIPVGGGTGAGPWLDSVTASPGTVVLPGATVQLQVDAEAREGGALAYSWSATGGTLAGNGAAATWVAPQESGTYTVTVTVSEPGQPSSSADVGIRVRRSVRLP